MNLAYPAKDARDLAAVFAAQRGGLFQEVTVNMLDLYLSERVKDLTRGTQTPVTLKPAALPDFPVALSP